jgi:hypothetical protein
MRQMKPAVEANLTQRGIPIPPRRVTQTWLFWFSLLCGPFLGSVLAIAIWKSFAG